MNKFSLKQLRYFDAVARLEHFGDAAHACSVTQPALSMQIKTLEDMLGQKLIERQSRRAKLTPFGEMFLAHAQEVLQSTNQLEEFVTRQSERNLRRLRLGVIPTIAPYILPQFMAQIRAEFGALELHLRETMTKNLIRDLHDNKLDTAILALPISDTGLEEFEIFREEFVLVRPMAQKDAPLPKREQLKEMHWLLLEEGHCFRDQALAVCNLDPAEPREVLDGSSLSTLVQMVATGMGVTLLPEISLPLETRKAQVSISRFDAPRPERRIGMVWRKETYLREEFLQIAKLLANLRPQSVAAQGDAALEKIPAKPLL